MFHCKDDFRNRYKITAREFNRHARFLNNLSSGFGIIVHRPDEPGPGNPVSISVDQEQLSDLFDGYAQVPAQDGDNNETDAAYVERALPEVVKFVEDEDEETTADAKARIGTSNLAAPLDHQHSIPFWINPLANGDDAVNNVQSEDVYVPDADEDTSDIDTSGSSPYAARADHYHIFQTEGATASNLVVYQIYRPTGQYNYWAIPYTLTIENGLITDITAGSAVDLNTVNTANVPTIS